MNFYVVGVFSKETNTLKLFEIEAETEFDAVKDVLFNNYNTTLYDLAYIVNAIHI